MIGFILITAVFLLSVFYYVFVKDRRNYLQKQGVPSPPGYPFLGHVLDLYFSDNRRDITEKYYYQYKKYGMFVLDEIGTPNLHMCDLDLIKEITVKAFDHFQDRRGNFGGSDKRQTENIINMRGEEWKNLRTLLTPTFSSGKIKGMFPIISEKADHLTARIKEDMDLQGLAYIRELTGYLLVDIIAACAFGLDTNCLTNRDISQVEFMNMANMLMTPSKSTLFKFTLLSIFPNLSKFLKVSLPKPPHDYMENLVVRTIEERKLSGLERGDYLDLLLELKDAQDKNPSQSAYDVSMNTIIAQSILFLMVGFDSTASALALIAYHLAQGTHIQNKLRSELKVKVGNTEDFNYQNIHECSYMDAVIAESLRIDSPGGVFLERRCNKDYTLENRNILIKKGTMVTFLPMAIQKDSEFWMEPEKFQPERFLAENKAAIAPLSYMPFGQGPRNCIAARFAMMVLKIATAKLVLHFELSLKPGAEKIKLMNTYDSIKPTDDGIQLVAKVPED